MPHTITDNNSSYHVWNRLADISQTKKSYKYLLVDLHLIVWCVTSHVIMQCYQLHKTNTSEQPLSLKATGQVGSQFT